MRAARATPDGYTITIGHWATHVLNGAIYQLQYDVQRDFEPVVLLANGPQLIIGKPTLPAQDFKELTAWLKDNPNKATAGTAGPGTGAHVAGVFFETMTRTELFLCSLSRLLGSVKSINISIRRKVGVGCMSGAAKGDDGPSSELLKASRPSLAVCRDVGPALAPQPPARRR